MRKTLNILIGFVLLASGAAAQTTGRQDLVGGTSLSSGATAPPPASCHTTPPSTSGQIYTNLATGAIYVCQQLNFAQASWVLTATPGGGGGGISFADLAMPDADTALGSSDKPIGPQWATGYYVLGNTLGTLGSTPGPSSFLVGGDTYACGDGTNYNGCAPWQIAGTFDPLDGGMSDVFEQYITWIPSDTVTNKLYSALWVANFRGSHHYQEDLIGSRFDLTVASTAVAEKNANATYVRPSVGNTASVTGNLQAWETERPNILSGGTVGGDYVAYSSQDLTGVIGVTGDLYFMRYPSDAAEKFWVNDAGAVFSASTVTAADFIPTEVAFASLPGSPVAGEIANVSDSNANTWGATVAGSGSNHVQVRWNGSNWTVVGK